jgi:Phosphotransferase enzyme family
VIRRSSSSSKFPSTKILSTGLNAVFQKLLPAGELTVLARKPNMFESTFASEIITCRSPGNGIFRVFCKYGTNDFDKGYGHRGGVSYEASVYSRVLAPLHTSTPTFYGVYKEERARRTWLLLEYVEGASQDISKTDEAVIHAARWIGRFHASNEKQLYSRRLSFLRRYDASYYIGWARRTNQLFGHQLGLRWLPPLCSKFEGLVPDLLAARKTVIHGEYYPSNVVYRNGTSRPADWQSAAVAVGQIDLAALTQNWPRRMARRMLREYKQTRWRGEGPDNFDRIFGIARVYMILRWLGDPNLASPSIRRSIFSRRTHRLSVGSQLLVRKYRRFLDALDSEREWLGLS